MAMQNPLFTLNQSLFFHIINNSEIYIYIYLWAVFCCIQMTSLKHIPVSRRFYHRGMAVLKILDIFAEVLIHFRGERVNSVSYNSSYKILVFLLIFSSQWKLVLQVFCLFIFNWRIIALQSCVGVYQTSPWISHRLTHVPPTWTLCVIGYRAAWSAAPQFYLQSQSRELWDYPQGLLKSRQTVLRCSPPAKREKTEVLLTDLHPLFGFGFLLFYFLATFLLPVITRCSRIIL